MFLIIKLIPNAEKKKIDAHTRIYEDYLGWAIIQQRIDSGLNAGEWPELGLLGFTTIASDGGEGRFSKGRAADILDGKEDADE